MICGYERESLIWECRWQGGEDWAQLPIRPGTHGVDAFFASRDPAKLAAIIAELLCECGLSVKTDPQYDCQWLVFADEYDAVSIVAPRFAKAITMPQARKLALALLDATNASAQDVERMIGEL